MSSMLRLVSSIVISVEVAIFAYLPYLQPKLLSNNTVTLLIDCFTSGLFMGLSLLHILPESNHDIHMALTRT
jgi:hypothetical protein